MRMTDAISSVPGRIAVRRTGRSWRRLGSLLSALVLGVLVDGCGQSAARPPAPVDNPLAPIDDFRATLVTVVTDPVRLKQMLDLTADARRACATGRVQLQALSSEVEALSRDMSTTPDALADANARLQAARVAVRTILLHDRCAIATLATDPEWNAISQHELGELPGSAP